jgi:hypothetical protein
MRFYSAFTAKMFMLTRRGLPGWTGFSALFGLWPTSSWWVSATVRVKL